MGRLRIRVELNKGGQGIVLDKLAAVAQHTVAFLHAFSSDVGLGDATRKWLAENFTNNSVDFDCRFTSGLDTPQLNRCRRALRLVFTNDYSDAEFSVIIRPETRRQFARIAAPIDYDEKIRFGLYPDE